MTAVRKIAIPWLFFVLSTNVCAAIDVCGAIGAGEVWSVADSPVNVSCDLNIVGLTIEPGVEVHVAGDYELAVSGVIRVLGTQEFPVVFKAAEDNVSGWGGFFFEDTVEGSEFVWSRIEGAVSSAVQLVRSSPSFDHVTFKNNSGTHGGAIRAELLDSDLRVSNSLFIDNFASTAGGAVYAVGPINQGDAAFEVTDSIFLQNNAGTTGGTTHNTYGGAIYVNGNSRILRSTFTENEARAYTIYASGGRYTRGGAIYSAGGYSEIVSSTFIGNACRMGAHSQTPDASRAYGGALYLHSGELLLSNSRLAENALSVARHADYRGSALYVGGGIAGIINSTMAYNNRHAVYRTGGQVEILNSILFFNNNSGAQIAGVVDVTYSDIQNGFDGEGNISLNPIFNEQFGIVSPSPAIDAGNPSPEYDDIFPPGQGGVRNDMGYTGGPAADHWNSYICYRDADGDGYGDPHNHAFMQSCNLEYVLDKHDCDDSDPNIFPGSGGSCAYVPSAKCGLISGEVWSVADSPVEVSCDLNIAELTIGPGVEVNIAGDFELVVSGVIRVLGTQQFPVVFKAAEDNVSGWGGFFFEDTVEGSEFVWSRIEGAVSSAVQLVRSSPSFDHVTFKHNSGTHGGAIRAELLDSDLRVSNSLFIDNFASTAGGAVYAVGPINQGDAAFEVTDSIFLQNNAGTTGGTTHNTYGGAIYADGNSRILRSTFMDNEARAYTIYASGGRYTRGGAIYSAGGYSEIVSTTFIGNACRMGAHYQTPDASRAYGGALYLHSGELLLSNSRLAENALSVARHADYRGSALYVGGGIASIVNSTMAYNNRHAVYRNGGVVEILNSILFFNNNSGAQIAGVVDVTYSDIQNGFDGEGNISLNPIFNEQFGIVSPSPAIDAGNPSPEYDDIFPPGQGGTRNDMGYTGGPATDYWSNYTDMDNDLINDLADNCPLVVNPSQTDTDNDGIGDTCQCGDQNGDGRVTNTDAVLIQRHLVGLPSPFNADLCDVNGDSNCSNTDAVIIKRAILGLPPGVSQSCAATISLP